MHLTFLNLTSDPITADFQASEISTDHYTRTILLPCRSITTKTQRRKVTLSSSSALRCENVSCEKLKEHYECRVKLRSLKTPLSMDFVASWHVVKVPQDCPWRLYRSRVTREHHRVLILRRRDMGSFLSEMPDNLSLSSLLLPGTHDAMAFYGWPVSQCQSLDTPLSTQLLSGIRVIDVRLAAIKGKLVSYHGVYPQRTPFSTILSILHNFLTSPRSYRETVVVSIKQEDFTITSPKTFSRLVRTEIERGPGGMNMWFLENRIPRLGEIRGRAVLFSRFGGDGMEWEGGLEGLGIHPSTWPDSAKHGFIWNCKGTLVRTHDWYSITSFLSIPEKVALATEVLIQPSPPVRPSPDLSITFLSAASFPLALPPSVAQGFGWPKWGFGVEGVNSRVGKWLLNLFAQGLDQVKKGEGWSYEDGSQPSEPRVRGWVLMDFFSHPEGGGLVPLLVECNYRGRIHGEEGW